MTLQLNLIIDAKKDKPASKYMSCLNLPTLWLRANGDPSNAADYYRLVPVSMGDGTLWSLQSMGDGNRWTTAMQTEDVDSYLRVNGFKPVTEDIAFLYVNNVKDDPPAKDIGFIDDEESYKASIDAEGLHIGCRTISFDRAEDIIEEMRNYLKEHGIES